VEEKVRRRRFIRVDSCFNLKVILRRRSRDYLYECRSVGLDVGGEEWRGKGVIDLVRDSRLL
jgi:hypothetical protein